MTKDEAEKAMAEAAIRFYDDLDIDRLDPEYFGSGSDGHRYRRLRDAVRAYRAAEAQATTLTPPVAPSVTLNEYQRANLLWLLRGCKRNFPRLDTGDWFGELVFLTERAEVYPNANADYFDQCVADDRIKEMKRQRDAWKQCHDDHCAMQCDFDPER